MPADHIEAIWDTASEKTKRIVAKAGMKVLQIKPDYDDYSEELELVGIRVAFKSKSGETKRGTILIYADDAKPVWVANRIVNYDGWEE